jgi:hypothetical protein
MGSKLDLDMTRKKIAGFKNWSSTCQESIFRVSRVDLNMPRKSMQGC